MITSSKRYIAWKGVLAIYLTLIVIGSSLRLHNKAVFAPSAKRLGRSQTTSLSANNQPPTSESSKSTVKRWLLNAKAGARKLFASSVILGASTLVPSSARAVRSLSSSGVITSTNARGSLFRDGVTPRLPFSRSESGSSNFVREAVRTVGPSVVRIDCEREISPLMGLFSDAYKEGDTVKVSGSGFVVSSDGYLLTNAHVIKDARSLTITLANGRTFKASIVAFDELTDLAVVKADTGHYQLTKAPLGDSASLQSGDWVIAVGCPVGLDFTVTLGIVSSPKRSAFEVGAINLKGSYIQTDAALNSGNSGGPLVNDAGEVIGINTMVRTNTEAIGFAIPINRAKQIYEILRQGRKPNHAYFGVEVMTLTPDFARIHNDDPNAQRLPEVHGALVVRVAPGSPAALSGFRKNDIIIDVNGDDVANAEDADFHLDKCKPGAAVKIRVLRGEPQQPIELHPNPLDLLAIIEERRAREQIITGLKPQLPKK